MRQSAELSLRHRESGLTFLLGASLAAGEDVRLWLRVRNSGREARRLQTVFPIVGRVRTDGDRRGLRYFYPWRSGIVGDVDAYLMNEYGNLAWMQVMGAFDPASGAAVSLYPRDSTGEVKGLILKKQSPEPGPMVRHCEVILQEEVPPAEPLDFDQGLGMACYALAEDPGARRRHRVAGGVAVRVQRRLEAGACRLRPLGAHVVSPRGDAGLVPRLLRLLPRAPAVLLFL